VTNREPKPDGGPEKRRYEPPRLQRVGTLKALTFEFTKGSVDTDIFAPFILQKRNPGGPF
jgi:hypothetical protein